MDLGGEDGIDGSPWSVSDDLLPADGPTENEAESPQHHPVRRYEHTLRLEQGVRGVTPDGWYAPWGTATIDGGLVPDRTPVTARKDGLQYAPTTTVANGWYAIDVLPDDLETRWKDGDTGQGS